MIPIYLLIILICIGLGIIIVLLGLIRKIDRPKEGDLLNPVIEALSDLKVLKDRINDLEHIKTQLTRSQDGQENLKQGLEMTRQTLDEVKLSYQRHQVLEEESRQAIKRLDTIIAGSHASGRAGENVLHEAFKQFPPDMIVTNFRVRDKVVEYGLKLANSKILPIDSKWPAAQVVLDLEKETDSQARLKLVETIDKEIIKRVKEVTQYIDPPATLPWAIAAIPDPAFSICRRAHLEAHRNRVHIMSYSMTIPYLLSFYSLHLEYSRSVDMENLKSYLAEIVRNLEEMESVLENKVARASTMVSNAYTEYKQLINSIKVSVIQLQSGSVDTNST
ncbi:MAG: DNA recombination protein RmuC [Candidatus Omnitrophica bacterium]|nr:DNA recombination protein RmuC [Candidatus Omnitrophota bacterium]